MEGTGALLHSMQLLGTTGFLPPGAAAAAAAGAFLPGTTVE
jgi:hypothetical protein